MVDQRLVEYIKENQEKGYPTKQIHDYLIQSGQSPKEVEEAIKFVNNPKELSSQSSESSSRGVILIFLAVIIIAAIGVLSYVYLREPTTSGLVGCGDQIIDCGTSKFVNDCYINAAKNCCPARIVSGGETEMFEGFIINSTWNREIRGSENGRCVHYERIREYSLSLSEETRQDMINRGLTEEEVNELITEQNQGVQEIIGKEIICKYLITDLVNKLEKERQGIFEASTNDQTTYQCTGSFYDME